MAFSDSQSESVMFSTSLPGNDLQQPSPMLFRTHLRSKFRECTASLNPRPMPHANIQGRNPRCSRKQQPTFRTENAFRLRVANVRKMLDGLPCRNPQSDDLGSQATFTVQASRKETNGNYPLPHLPSCFSHASITSRMATGSRLDRLSALRPLGLLAQTCFPAQDF